MSTPLAVTTWGSGDARTVALHGWGGSHATFLPFLPHIPASHRVIAPDLPGYGASELPERWETARIAEMVASSVGVDHEVTVVGNCTGGVIGAELAMMYPEIVSRLVLIDPFAYVPWYFSLFLKGNFGRMAYKTTFASPVGRYFTNQALRGKRTGDSDLTGSFSRVNHEAVYAFLRMMSEHEGPSRYTRLAIPIDIITGEKTFGAVRKSVGMLRQTWPGAQAHVIEGAGHLPIEEQGERVAELVFGDE
jgi:pimeloyl-ACP methyl ester carboxylesterase